MFYLYWILVFLKNFLDCEKIDVRIQILKRHKLSPLPPKRHSGAFCPKIDLRVVQQFIHALIEMIIIIRYNKYNIRGVSGNISEILSFEVTLQLAFTWSKLTIETLEQGVKYVQS